MAIIGWYKKYAEILKEFGYTKNKDIESAELLNSLLKNPVSTKKLRQLIEGQTIFVVGAGPSLSTSIPTLKKYKEFTKIVADGATKALIQNKIRPEIVVTDFDGDVKSLQSVGKSKTIMVVHAHGDNIDKLQLVDGFKNCIGTTETKPFGKIHNFGGFTDGDRCVFLARYFNPKRIILFGMDFGLTIGKYSKTKINNRTTKLKKLRRGKKLLEWLAEKNSLEFYTTSGQIKGFKKIHYKDLRNILANENAF